MTTAALALERDVRMLIIRRVVPPSGRTFILSEAFV
jgi:hypothetical protein